MVLHNAARVSAATFGQLYCPPSINWTAFCSANGSGGVRASRLLLLKKNSWRQEEREAKSDMLEKIVQEIKKYARPPVKHVRRRATAPFDERKESVNVFASFLDDADMTGKRDVDDLAGDKTRIPIAVNSGTAGSGKTTQLEILCNEFSRLRPGGKFVYCTMNGENSRFRDFDASYDIDVRIAHRIIHAAANPSVSVQRFWGLVRRNLGMAGLGAAASNTYQDSLENVLDSPQAIVAVCRRVLDLDDATPLLLAVDELRKLGKDEPPVGEVSDVAVSALKSLASLSQWSFVEQHRSGTKPTYVIGSAYTAYDPSKGITEGSDRTVHFLPLPPLQLSCGWDARICEAAGRDEKEKLAGRTLLWFSQRNARMMDRVFGDLLAAKAANQKWHDVLEKQKARVDDSPAAIHRYLEACAKKSLDPAVIVQNLFWARPSNTLLKQFHDSMKQALLAEASGLCSIIREEYGDTVYMHPVYLQQLCKKLEKGVHNKPYMSAVLELCTAMQELPSMPKEDSGKLYEKIVTLAFVCRAATCFDPEVTVGELLGSKQTSVSQGEKGVFSRLVKTLLLEQQKIEAFPRAAERLPGGGGWRNVECTGTPRPGTYFIPSDPYNTVLDSGLSLLPNKGDTKPVLVALQMKELAHPTETITNMFSDDGRASRGRQMEWGGTHQLVSQCLDQQDMVLVAVTPNPVENVTLAPWLVANHSNRNAGFTCHEVLVTNADIRKWSPMAAFSACDARVLQMAEMNSQAASSCGVKTSLQEKKKKHG